MSLGGCLLHPRNCPAYGTQSRTRETGAGGKLATDLLRSWGTNCVVRSGMWTQAQSRVADLFCSTRSQTPVPHVIRFSIRADVSRFRELSGKDNRRRAILLRQDRVHNRFVTASPGVANLVRTARYSREDHVNTLRHANTLVLGRTSSGYSATTAHSESEAIEFE